MKKKNRVCLVILTILVFSSVLAILKLNTYKEYKSINDNSNENETKSSELKEVNFFDTKYSINDMYDLISKNEIPDDEEFDDILLNWFDYFSENNLFINHFGESYDFSEYQRIKDEYSGETLKVLLINAKKSWFLPILSE